VVSAHVIVKGKTVAAKRDTLFLIRFSSPHRHPCHGTWVEVSFRPPGSFGRPTGDWAVSVYYREMERGLQALDVNHT